MNTIDLAIILVLVISGVFALIRGFVHEVLAIAGWIAAPLAALWTLPETEPIARRFIASELAAKVVAGVVVFLVVLLVCSVITHAVARKVQASALGSVDRTLGFVFGLARGLVACCLAYLVVTWLMPKVPDVVAEARLAGVLQKGADAIQAILPHHIDELRSEAEKAAGAAQDAAQDAAQNAAKAADSAQAASQTYKALTSPQPAPPSGAPRQPDYDQSGMDRLVGNTNR